MSNREVDVAIIGAGTAGLNAQRELEKADVDWVLVESGPYGTTCARVGCMPSKLLIAASDAAHEIEGAEEFGIRIEERGWEVDGPAVFERVRSERDRFANFVVESTMDLPEKRRIRGHAEFVGPTTLEIDGERRIETGAVVVATGSSPWIPPSLEAIRDEVMTSADVFELREVPETLAVVGTGVIGLELGQALQRLGADVEFFNPFDELGIFTDPAVDEVAHEVFGERLDLHLETEIYRTDRVDGGLLLRWRTPDGDERHGVFDEVLAAAGRRPNLEGLNLEATELELDSDGLPEIDPRTTQAGDAPIFFAGDVAGHRPVLHEASDEGRIAGSNAARYPEITAAVRRTKMEIAFSDPQMAVVGKRFADLERDATAVGEVSYADQGRARVMDVDEGIVRLYGEKEDCTFVGAELFGPRAENMAHLLAWAAQQRMTVSEMLSMPFYHPVLEEGLRTALRELCGELRISGRCPPEDCAGGPGS